MGGCINKLLYRNNCSVMSRQDDRQRLLREDKYNTSSISFPTKKYESSSSSSSSSSSDEDKYKKSDVKYQRLGDNSASGIFDRNYNKYNNKK